MRGRVDADGDVLEEDALEVTSEAVQFRVHVHVETHLAKSE